jgi:hypothetical protein
MRSISSRWGSKRSSVDTCGGEPKRWGARAARMGWVSRSSRGPARACACGSPGRKRAGPARPGAPRRRAPRAHLLAAASPLQRRVRQPVPRRAAWHERRAPPAAAAAAAASIAAVAAAAPACAAATAAAAAACRLSLLQHRAAAAGRVPEAEVLPRKLKAEGRPRVEDLPQRRAPQRRDRGREAAAQGEAGLEQLLAKEGGQRGCAGGGQIGGRGGDGAMSE